MSNVHLWWHEMNCDIFQTTLWDVFPSIGKFKFVSKLHWNLILMVLLARNWHWYIYYVCTDYRLQANTGIIVVIRHHHATMSYTPHENIYAGYPDWVHSSCFSFITELYCVEIRERVFGYCVEIREWVFGYCVEIREWIFGACFNNTWLLLCWVIYIYNKMNVSIYDLSPGWRQISYWFICIYH